MKKEYTIQGNEIEDFLVNTKKRNYVSMIKLNIESSIDGQCIFIYRHPPFDDDLEKYEVEIMLDKGEMTKHIQTDWYEPECMIRIVPNNLTVRGKVEIEYIIY
jgi:hypothetical protein